MHTIERDWGRIIEPEAFLAFLASVAQFPAPNQIAKRPPNVERTVEVLRHLGHRRMTSGIDDEPPLNDAEKRATVGDLIRSRSGAVTNPLATSTSGHASASARRRAAIVP